MPQQDGEEADRSALGGHQQRRYIEAEGAVKSRLVAQEINQFKQPELFAATLPVECIRYLISCCASSQWTSRPARVMTQDVIKTHFYAPATRRVFMRAPLGKSLYGTRDAAFNWTHANTTAFEILGFIDGASSLAASDMRIDGSTWMSTGMTSCPRARHTSSDGSMSSSGSTLSSRLKC